MRIATNGYASTEGAESDAIASALRSLGSPLPPPTINFLATETGRLHVETRMTALIEEITAGGSAVTKDALRKRFTQAEIDACFEGAVKRVRPSIRDIAAAA